MRVKFVACSDAHALPEVSARRSAQSVENRD